MIALLRTFLSALGLLALPAAVAAAECGDPPEPVDGWAVATPVQAGLDDAKLCALARRMAPPNAQNIHGVLIVRNGDLVFEAYGSGDYKEWGRPKRSMRFDAETRHEFRSISKSVVSLLVGIAIDRRLIGSVRDPIFDYLPQYADLRTPEREGIEIADLLTMTSGLLTRSDVPYDDPGNTERLMAWSTDPYRFALARDLVAEPGTLWAYDSGSTMLLSAILQQATGQPLLDFAREALFEPLGITDVDWFSLTDSGETAAFAGLRLRPRDMARVGQLVLDGGVWNGQRVVSQAWVAEAPRRTRTVARRSASATTCATATSGG